MAKGQNFKTEITNKILETFPGSFVYDKEIRIPGQEDGEIIQIKVALTCAKTNVEQGEENAIPGEVSTIINNDQPPVFNNNTPVEMTQEEKDNIARLAEKLGF